MQEEYVALRNSEQLLKALVDGLPVEISRQIRVGPNSGVKSLMIWAIIDVTEVPNATRWLRGNRFGLYQADEKLIYVDHPCLVYQSDREPSLIYIYGTKVTKDCEVRELGILYRDWANASGRGMDFGFRLGDVKWVDNRLLPLFVGKFAPPPGLASALHDCLLGTNDQARKWIIDQPAWYIESAGSLIKDLAEAPPYEVDPEAWRTTLAGCMVALVEEKMATLDPESDEAEDVWFSMPYFSIAKPLTEIETAFDAISKLLGE